MSKPKFVKGRYEYFNNDNLEIRIYFPCQTNNYRDNGGNGGDSVYRQDLVSESKRSWSETAPVRDAGASEIEDDRDQTMLMTTPTTPTSTTTTPTTTTPTATTTRYKTVKTNNNKNEKAGILHMDVQVNA
ncbi:hypothetical protein V1478_010773 [Vespula squamosa]|uniref:Uncharacterized protein n=1 Tax=Vespula squamosa TaxID=30214 RepID=A0ABD2AFB2_VESSQ